MLKQEFSFYRHLLVNIYSTQLSQYEEVVVRSMDLKIINVACSIKLPKHLKLLSLGHQSLDIDHVWSITEHAGVIIAI